jgi:hypothetical protein
MKGTEPGGARAGPGRSVPPRACLGRRCQPAIGQGFKQACHRRRPGAVENCSGAACPVALKAGRHPGEAVVVSYVVNLRDLQRKSLTVSILGQRWIEGPIQDTRDGQPWPALTTCLGVSRKESPMGDFRCYFSVAGKTENQKSIIAACSPRPVFQTLAATRPLPGVFGVSALSNRRLLRVSG